MTPTEVKFSGLSFDPSLVTGRQHRGVIPLNWHKVRFIIPADAVVDFPVSKMNRWLATNIEGRWSIYMRWVAIPKPPANYTSLPMIHTLMNKGREVTIAFEKQSDAVAFVLSDGKTESLKV